jgi:hypothetical protein
MPILQDISYYTLSQSNGGLGFSPGQRRLNGHGPFWTTPENENLLSERLASRS